MNEVKAIQDKYNILEKALNNTNQHFKRAAQEKDKLGEKARHLIKQRQQLMVNKKQNRKHITEISKNINESIRKHRSKVRLERIRTSIESTGGIKKSMKDLIHEKAWIPSIKNKNQDQVSKRSQIIETATEFYKELYNEDFPTDASTYCLNNYNEDIPDFLNCEVEHAIRTQKNDKSPGEDNIRNELLKIAIDVIINPLTQLFNAVLKEEIIPTQWTKNIITLLHKKGDKNEINNYRPISLMSNIYKVFSKVILGRITKVLEENQPVEQAGFRKNYATIDHIHVIKQIIEKFHEYNKHYYIAFVDYNKAFDSLKHSEIWKSLNEQGVPHKYIRIIMQLYKHNTAKIKLERIGEEFEIKKGVRQGDPLSPKIFTAVLETVFRRLNWEEHGLNINGTKLNHLRFADDLILLTDDPAELQSMLTELEEQSKLVGLTMNTSKTKLMTNGAKKHIKMDGKDMEYVEEYVYLGQVISPINQTSKEIQTRIDKAWKKFWSLKEVLKSNEVPTYHKFKILNSCVLPVLMYGCQTWGLTSFQYKKLNTSQNNMERSILNIKLKDKIRLTKIKSISKTRCASEKVRELKWRWAGHFLRQSMGKWTTEITEWYPRDGRRSRGRPMQRWSDDIRRVGGCLWTRKARDRGAWKSLEEAYVQGTS
jgi:hypothetical protein